MKRLHLLSFITLLGLISCDFPILSSTNSIELSSIVSNELSSSHLDTNSETTNFSSSIPEQTITISRETWTDLSVYPSEPQPVIFDGVTFEYHLAGNYTSGVIQGKRNGFYFANRDPLSPLHSITITLRDVHEGLVMYEGDSFLPETLTREPSLISATTYFYDFSLNSFDYFHLMNTGSVVYIESIVIAFGGSTQTTSSSDTTTSSQTSSTSSASTIPSSSETSSASSSQPTTTVVSNAPQYYQSISPSLTGNALKDALDTLISSNINVSYDWSRFEYIDQHPEDATRVLTIYPKRGYLKSAHVNGNTPDHWNREHTYPQSKIGGNALSDNHHIFADDWKTNGERGNDKFGDVANTTSNLVYDSSNRPTENYSAGGLFEPNDEAKGEVARATLYMNTLYGYSLENNFETAELAVLWALDYPVNDWAMTRNNRVYDKQGNRNPYIDHPEWICAVYGTTSTQTRQACGL